MTGYNIALDIFLFLVGARLGLWGRDWYDSRCKGQE